MTYPSATAQHIRSFQEDGFLVVEDALAAGDCERLQGVARHIIRHKEEMARDWDWRRGEDQTRRAFRIVQCGVTARFPWVADSVFRRWAAAFTSTLMQRPMEFWYDQFLGKPPQMGAATPWHQDEAYWGRSLEGLGITCWMSFHDVDETRGCMHFVRGGHRLGVLDHVNPAEMASDLLVCEVAEDAEVVPCPLKTGSVTFHHSKTPHMSTANTSGNWRLTLAQHFSAPECRQVEADHYPWRVAVDQNARVRAPDAMPAAAAAGRTT